MRQVVQPLAGGPVEVLEVPRPHGYVGSERAVTALAQSSLLAKARARPDLVRQVVHKVQVDGLAATRQAVRSRLAGDLPLGYSAAGIAVAVGPAVSRIRTGQLIATAARARRTTPNSRRCPGCSAQRCRTTSPPADAAFTTITPIALHGLRQADVGPGSKVVVQGLGLIGQLAAGLALASAVLWPGLTQPSIRVRSRPLRGCWLALDEHGDASTGQICPGRVDAARRRY